MGNTKVSFKKALSLLLVLCMVVALVPAASVSANSADLKSLAVKLDGLLTSNPAGVKAVANATWEYIKACAYDSEKVPDSQEALDIVKSTLAANSITGIITEDGAGDSISEASLKSIIESALSYKTLLVTEYSLMMNSGVKNQLLASVEGADDNGDLLIKLIAKLKEANLQIVTKKDDGSFGLVEGKLISSSLTSVFGLTADTDEMNAFLLSLDLAYFQLIDKINEKLTENSIDPQHVIEVLSLYGLYKAPVEPSPSATPKPTNPPSSGGDGGIIIAPSATPTAAPTATPTTAPTATANPAIPGGAEEIKNITDPAKALDKAVELITGAADLINNAESAAKPVNEISQAMLEIAQAVLEKVNTQTVTAEASADGAKAAVSSTEAAKITESINTIIETAQKLTDTLKSAGADTKVESVLNIKAEAPADTSKVGVEIPASLLAAAAEKKLDKVAIDTGISKLVAAPDVVMADGSKTVEFTAAKLDNSKLPEDVKKAVGENPVYDYNLLVDGKQVSSFSKPVEILIPYVLKEGENANKLTVFYIDDEGKLQNVVGTYDAATGSVKFMTSHFSYYVVKANNVSFNDIASYAWAKDSIETMAAKGIINGVGEGKYAPEANITRAEFAAMMVRAFSLQDSTAENTFTDVDNSDWFVSEVAAAVKAGLIQGSGEGMFAPDENISRQDMAVIMARALTAVKGKAKPASLSTYVEKFADINDIADYAKDAVAMTVRYEIVKGMTANTFVPANEATRAEAAAMMYRIFFIK